MSEGYRVAVVGATGQVGTLMLRLLRERGFPAREVVPFASARSVGRVLEGAAPDGGDLTVQPLDEESIRGFDLALFSAGGSTSGEWAPRFAAAGAVVVDNSSRWRMQDDVPLVVSEVNPDALDGHRGIVANPNCSTMQMVVALKPLHDAAGIERLVISTYQAVSGTGRQAVDELLDQSHALLHEREIAPPQAYAHQIAFNALPHAGSFAAGEDHTDEERKLIERDAQDPRRRRDPRERDVRTRAGRDGAFRGRERPDPRPPHPRASPRAAAGGARGHGPRRPRRCVLPAGDRRRRRDDVFVGRIRRDPGHERALDLWIVADNLRKGAARTRCSWPSYSDERGLIGSRKAHSPA